LTYKEFDLKIEIFGVFLFIVFLKQSKTIDGPTIDSSPALVKIVNTCMAADSVNT